MPDEIEMGKKEINKNNISRFSLVSFKKNKNRRWRNMKVDKPKEGDAMN